MLKVTTAVWLAPPDSTARVDIGSYSADPTGNLVSYGEQSQTVPLKEKNVVVKFAVEANSQTSQGRSSWRQLSTKPRRE
jgi:hypothetical protein